MSYYVTFRAKDYKGLSDFFAELPQDLEITLQVENNGLWRVDSWEGNPWYTWVSEWIDDLAIHDAITEHAFEACECAIADWETNQELPNNYPENFAGFAKNH